MSFLDQTNKHLDTPSVVTKTKRLSNFLGTNHTLSLVRKLQPSDLGKNLQKPIIP
jgi:hypothetical protein